MPRPPAQSGPTSAIESELLSAALPLRHNTSRANEESGPDSDRFVRREFAITNELDEYIGFCLVPLLRRLLNAPVNRSMVLRGILGALSDSRVRLEHRLSGVPPTSAAMSLDGALVELFHEAFSNGGGGQ